MHRPFSLLEASYRIRRDCRDRQQSVPVTRLWDDEQPHITVMLWVHEFFPGPRSENLPFFLWSTQDVDESSQPQRIKPSVQIRKLECADGLQPFVLWPLQR